MVNKYLETKCEICGYYGGAHHDHCRRFGSDVPVGVTWRKFPDEKPEDQQICIVAGGPGRVAQIIPLRWYEIHQEFHWHEDSDGLGLDPYPTEVSTHWMPWPDDPK